MYNKINNMPLHIKRTFDECGSFKPITDLGFMTADERINSIMQAGQILQEARAEQFAYKQKVSDGLNHADYDNDPNDTDVSTINYVDKMDMLDIGEQLEASTLAKAKTTASTSSNSVEQTVENGSESNETTSVE